MATADNIKNPPTNNDEGGTQDAVQKPKEQGQGQDAGQENTELVLNLETAPDEGEDQGKAPGWIRELRKSQREIKKRNAELEAEVATLKGSTSIAVTDPGKKPELSEFDYDADLFGTALTDWHDKKRKLEEQNNAAKHQQEEVTREWQKNLASYTSAKEALNVTDYEEAEEAVIGSLSEIQQGIIIQGAKNAAHIILALGRNQGKLASIAAIKDPVKFAFEVAHLEATMKISGKKTPPNPDSTLRGSGSSASGGNADTKLEQLREDAAKTGDFTKVLAYKQQLKKAKA